MDKFLTGAETFYIAINLSGILEMGSFKIIVVKLYSYKHSGVGNV